MKLTYEAVQSLITFALPLTLQTGGQRRWISYFKLNWWTKGSCVLFTYLEICFLSSCTDCLLWDRIVNKQKTPNKQKIRCISFKVASLNVVMWLFYFITRTVLSCLAFECYYVFLYYYRVNTAFSIFYSISCLFPRDCPELFVSNCYLCEDCNFELVKT